MRGSELLAGAEAQELPRLNLVGTPSERPWYFAIAASSGLHLALIAVAGWIFIDAKASVRPVDLEAAWVEGEVAETFAPPALRVVEPSSRSGRNRPEPNRSRTALGRIADAGESSRSASTIGREDSARLSVIDQSVAGRVAFRQRSHRSRGTSCLRGGRSTRWAPERAAEAAAPGRVVAAAAE